MKLFLGFLLITTAAFAQNSPPRPGTTGRTIPRPANIPAWPSTEIAPTPVVIPQPPVIVAPVPAPVPAPAPIPDPVVVAPPAAPVTVEPEPIPDMPTPSRAPRPSYEPNPQPRQPRPTPTPVPTPTPTPRPTPAPTGSFTWNKNPSNYNRYRNDQENILRVGELVIYRSKYYTIRSGLESSSSITLNSTVNGSSYSLTVVSSELSKTKGCVITPAKRVCVGDQMIDLNRRPYKVLGFNSENYVVIQSQDEWVSVYEDIDPRDLDPR